MRFILGLKGTQFISGIFKLVTVCMGFWQCSVTVPQMNGCALDGPGVGRSTLRDILILIWLQVLLWIAFLLLPFSGVYDARNARVDFTRSRQLWERAKLEGTIAVVGADVDLSAQGHVAAARARSAKKKKAGYLVQSLVPSRVFGKKGAKPAQAPAQALVFPRGLPSPRGPDGYTPLVDANAPLSDRPDGPATHASSSVSPPGSEPLPFPRSMLVWTLEAAERLQSMAMAVSYPMRSGESKNRLFSLLTFDTRAFLGCSALFVLMSLVSVHA